MPLRYRVRKMGAGTVNYTTRPDLAAPLTESEVVDELIQSSAISEGDVRSVLTNLRRILVNAAQQSRPSESLFGLFLGGGESFDDLFDPLKPSFGALLRSDQLFEPLFRSFLGDGEFFDHVLEVAQVHPPGLIHAF